MSRETSAIKCMASSVNGEYVVAGSDLSEVLHAIADAIENLEDATEQRPAKKKKPKKEPRP